MSLSMQFKFCTLLSGDNKCVFFPGSNTALHEFLHARNPKNQHSGTLESYLIKPIQVNNVIVYFLLPLFKPWGLMIS